MPEIRMDTRLFWVLFSAICCLCGQESRAQVSRTLVVVADATDEVSFKRIGSSVIDVKVLFFGKNRIRRDYDVCNDQAKNLCDFRFVFYRAGPELPAEKLWRQRLVTANPQIEFLRLNQARVRPFLERQAEQARTVHRALVAKFPEQRETLDANLRSELHRLYFLKVPPLQLASVER